MGLTVVIHTHGSRDQWLTDAVASAHACMPKDANLVIEICPTPEVWAKARSGAIELDDYVCFIDDDDLVINNSIALCWDAIRKYDVGLAFTDEQCMDVQGAPMVESYVMPKAHDVKGLTFSPRKAHHVCIFKTSLITGADLAEYSKLALSSNSLLDWFLRMVPAMREGAVYVDVVGYLWRRWPGSDSSKPNPKARQDEVAVTLALQGMLSYPHPRLITVDENLNLKK